MAQNFINHRYKLIIFGGSSGSLDALLTVFTFLDPAFNIPIVVVVHRNSNANESLAQVLASKTDLLIKEADEKEFVLPGKVYIAPPDYHLLFEKNGSLSLDDSEKVRFSRPSIDVSFQSAADVYKKELVAVLLSGSNADGAAGMLAIKQQGGVTIIQNPEEALFNHMPLQAKSKTSIDHTLTAVEIARLLNTFID